MAKSCKIQWVFEWIGGGYNTVCADTKAKALVLARKKGAPVKGGMRKTLKVKPSTLQRATPALLRDYNRITI